MRLVPFRTAPFPYRGDVPGEGKPFLDVTDGARRGHTTARGGVYWEDETYSDPRVLLALPEGFDVRRPAAIVVYFHGNEAVIDRDVRDRQQVVRQLADSGLNAALVAPQLAVNARDSSAGHFWEAQHFARFLQEAGGQLARLCGGAVRGDTFDQMPVVIVAYSGGYVPAAYALGDSAVSGHIRGLIMLDAAYGEGDRIAAWVAEHRQSVFLLSAYGTSSRDGNLTLQRLLATRRIPFATTLPARLGPGSIAFIDAGDEVAHGDFVTLAWDVDPLAAALSRIAGFPRSKH